MLRALRPIAVPVRIVAGEHDEVVAEDVDDAGQDRLFRLARRPDVARLQILLRIALPATFDPVAALLEVLMQTVDEERHPADTRFEERHSESGVAVKYTSRYECGHCCHLVERETDAVHLDV